MPETISKKLRCDLRLTFHLKILSNIAVRTAIYILVLNYTYIYYSVYEKPPQETLLETIKAPEEYADADVVERRFESFLPVLDIILLREAAI